MRSGTGGESAQSVSGETTVETAADQVSESVIISDERHQVAACVDGLTDLQRGHRSAYCRA